MAVGTNIGLLPVMWAMSNGSFLQSRGAVHSALAESGFADEAIQQSWSALGYGAWSIDEGYNCDEPAFLHLSRPAPAD